MIRKAILTKVLPSTITKPYRIKAFDCDGNSVCYSTDATLNESEHLSAARLLCEKMRWTAPLVGGGYVGVRGIVYAFVFHAELP